MRRINYWQDNCVRGWLQSRSQKMCQFCVIPVHSVSMIIILWQRSHYTIECRKTSRELIFSWWKLGTCGFQMKSLHTWKKNEVQFTIENFSIHPINRIISNTTITKDTNHHTSIGLIGCFRFMETIMTIQTLGNNLHVRRWDVNTDLNSSIDLNTLSVHEIL